MNAGAQLRQGFKLAFGLGTSWERSPGGALISPPIY